MKKSVLLAALEQQGVERNVLPSGKQLERTKAFADLYESRGLLVGDATPPLRHCCENGDACWRRVESRFEGYGISLPWGGPDYEPGGVVVLGMNFDDYGGLHAGFYLAACELRDFAAGRRTMRYGNEYARYRGSPFAYRSTRSAAAVIAYRDGREVTDLKAPQDLTMALRRVVRLQTVKCSPDTGAIQPRRCGRAAPRCFWQMSSQSRSLDTCLGLATTSAVRSGSYEASRPAGSGPDFTLVRSYSRAVTPNLCFCITHARRAIG